MNRALWLPGIELLAESGAMRVEIYALSDETGIRYIGKANDSAKRLKSHLREAWRYNRPVHIWIRKLQEVGKLPTISILEITTQDGWDEAERRHISAARAASRNLLNLADGGVMPKSNPEQNRKNAQRLNNRLRDDKLFRVVKRAKMMVGVILNSGEGSDEFRAKLRQYAKDMPDLFGVWLDLPDRVET